LNYADSLAQLDLRLKVFGDETPVALSRGLGPMVFARRGEIYESRLSREQYEGKGLLELRIPAAAKPGTSAQRLHGKTWFQAEIPAPAAPAQPRTVPGRVLLLWDVSGSGAGRDHGRELVLLDRYFRRMGGGEVELVAFRDRPEPARTFRVAQGNWGELRDALEQMAYDGATRLDLLSGIEGAEEALLVSDGLINYGPGGLPDLGMPLFAISSSPGADAADQFFERNKPRLALRLLSNLAEMDLENRHLLRILAYRLLQAEQPELAVPMLIKVRDLAPDEPQSWRDLGLAYGAAGRFQEALDSLYEVVRRPWDGRFPEIALIALAELNALVAAVDPPLATDGVDPRLLRNLPLDLRVVLTWDADNSDIDLWIIDPNGEKCFYGNRLSYQGGRMSPDFTGGYGPEEFSLRQAKPGKYLVQANFYGHRQQVVAGATTLQLDLFTGFATPEQAGKSVTLRLQGPKEVVTVGEFFVK